MTSHRAYPSQRDSGPAHASPSASGRAAPSLKPSERYVLIAHRLGCSPKEAELLWLLATSAPMTCKVLGNRMSSAYSNARVLVYKLRTLRGIPIESHPYVGYSLRPAIREFILSVVSDAPSGAMPSLGVSSLWTGGVANGPALFQPAGDPTRQVSKSDPSHTATLSSSSSGAPRDDNRSNGQCSLIDRTIHP